MAFKLGVIYTPAHLAHSKFCVVLPLLELNPNMPSSEKYVLGANNRGPLLTPGDGDQGLEKLDSAGGRSLTRTPTRTEKIRRHWKRFWLFYCIGNVIFLAIFLPILYVFLSIPGVPLWN